MLTSGLLSLEAKLICLSKMSSIVLERKALYIAMGRGKVVFQRRGVL